MMLALRQSSHPEGAAYRFRSRRFARQVRLHCATLVSAPSNTSPEATTPAVFTA